MANPERHEMIFDIVEDILELAASDDESAQNFRNVLYITYGIMLGDVKDARDEMIKLINLFKEQCL